MFSFLPGSGEVGGLNGSGGALDGALDGGVGKVGSKSRRMSRRISGAGGVGKRMSVRGQNGQSQGMGGERVQSQSGEANGVSERTQSQSGQGVSGKRRSKRFSTTLAIVPPPSRYTRTSVVDLAEVAAAAQTSLQPLSELSTKELPAVPVSGQHSAFSDSIPSRSTSPPHTLPPSKTPHISASSASTPAPPPQIPPPAPVHEDTLSATAASLRHQSPRILSQTSVILLEEKDEKDEEEEGPKKDEGEEERETRGGGGEFKFASSLLGVVGEEEDDGAEEKDTNVSDRQDPSHPPDSTAGPASYITTYPASASGHGDDDGGGGGRGGRSGGGSDGHYSVRTPDAAYPIANSPLWQEVRTLVRGGTCVAGATGKEAEDRDVRGGKREGGKGDVEKDAVPVAAPNPPPPSELPLSPPCPPSHQPQSQPQPQPQPQQLSRFSDATVLHEERGRQPSSRFSDATALHGEQGGQLSLSSRFSDATVLHGEQGGQLSLSSRFSDATVLHGERGGQLSLSSRFSDATVLHGERGRQPSSRFSDATMYSPLPEMQGLSSSQFSTRSTASMSTSSYGNYMQHPSTAFAPLEGMPESPVGVQVQARIQQIEKQNRPLSPPTRGLPAIPVIGGPVEREVQPASRELPVPPPSTRELPALVPPPTRELPPPVPRPMRGLPVPPQPSSKELSAPVHAPVSLPLRDLPVSLLPRPRKSSDLPPPRPPPKDGLPPPPVDADPPEFPTPISVRTSRLSSVSNISNAQIQGANIALVAQASIVSVKGHVPPQLQHSVSASSSLKSRSSTPSPGSSQQSQRPPPLPLPPPGKVLPSLIASQRYQERRMQKAQNRHSSSAGEGSQEGMVEPDAPSPASASSFSHSPVTSNSNESGGMLGSEFGHEVVPRPLSASSASYGEPAGSDIMAIMALDTPTSPKPVVDVQLAQEDPLHSDEEEEEEDEAVPLEYLPVKANTGPQSQDETCEASDGGSGCRDSYSKPPEDQTLDYYDHEIALATPSITVNGFEINEEPPSNSSPGEEEPPAPKDLPLVLTPLSEYIYVDFDPREMFSDLLEVAQGQYGSVYAAKVSSSLLGSPDSVVAVKKVPIPANGTPKIGQLLHELNLMSQVRHKHILGSDGLFFDFAEDMLWVRMELMVRSLADVLVLSEEGLELEERVIARFASDVSLSQFGFVATLLYIY